MNAVFELDIQLPPRSARGLLGALHRQLRTAIVDRRLQPGLRLPPTRVLARSFGISRNTAVAAYDLLLAEGYLVARRGSGTYVADTLPAPAARPRGGGRPAGARLLHPYWRSVGYAAPAPVDPLLRHDFRLGVPDKSLFPFEVWRRLSARALRNLSRTPAAYADAQGRDALRAAIAKHVSFARAVSCRPEDLVVTAGAQQAFTLLAQVLVVPGRTVVAVENPGYPPARAVFEAAGARIVTVPVDEEGLVVERLPAEARIVLVTPSHQFPLGVAMSARRRAGLLAFARARGAVVIEDDYDGEFRYGGRPLDALQTLDRAESVFYVGTFSKSLFPGLRLGFVVAPPWALAALCAAKQCNDWHAALLAQDTLAAFIAEGHLARHVRKMREVYARRRTLLLNGLKSLDAWMSPLPSTAGLHLAATTAPGLDVEALAQRARAHQLGLYTLREHGRGRGRRAGLVFGFGVTAEPAIAEGLSTLRRLLRS